MKNKTRKHGGFASNTSYIKSSVTNSNRYTIKNNTYKKSILPNAIKVNRYTVPNAVYVSKEGSKSPLQHAQSTSVQSNRIRISNGSVKHIATRSVSPIAHTASPISTNSGSSNTQIVLNEINPVKGLVYEKSNGSIGTYNRKSGTRKLYRKKSRQSRV